MNEWTTVTVIIALAGFVTAVVTPIVKLNTAITRLGDSVEALRADMGEQAALNVQTHDKIFVRLDGADKALAECDKRISLLEKGERMRV